MRLSFCFILWIFFLAPALPLGAQEAVKEQLNIGNSGSSYLRAIRLRRIDSDVVYFDPTAPAPRFATSQELENPPDDRQRLAENWQIPYAGIRPLTIAITVGILVVTAYLIIRFGGNISVVMRAEAQNPSHGRSDQKSKEATKDVNPGSLDAILRTGDRRRALILLAQKALTTTVASNGLLLLRSWTARDALRHIPKDQLHLDALRNLVMASEHVQFGARDVTEEEFREHFSKIKPLFRGKMT